MAAVRAAGSAAESVAPVPAALDLGEHRLLGDGRGTALLTPDARLVWWCPEAPHSPPALSQLLDPAGGWMRWLGTSGDPSVVHTSPAGPLLRTSLRSEQGRLECVDGLIGRDALPGAVVRLVRNLDAPLDISHETCNASLGDLPSPELLITTPSGLSPITPRQVRHDALAAPHGQWAALVVGLASDGAFTQELAAATPEELLARLQGAHRDVESAISAALLPSHHPDRAADSLRVLHALTWHPTGAVLAAPTTSLPEALPGNRTFDYRFSWLRDAGLSVSVASLVGLDATARAFLDFTTKTFGTDPMQAPIVVTVEAAQVDKERELPGVAGWHGGLPVRIGNDARGQVQHDALGIFCESVAVHLQTGSRVRSHWWTAVAAIADGIATYVLSGVDVPTSGVWELRQPYVLVSEDIGRWLALDRAMTVGRFVRPWRSRGDWAKARDLVRQRVLSALKDDGELPVAFDADLPGPDAAALLIPVLGMERRDPRVRAMVHRIIDELGSGPFLRRYPPGPVGELSWDGFIGREGAFLPSSFLAVSALAAVGDVDEATTRMEELLARLPRLLPEEFDPEQDCSLGNTPLLWSHTELLRALYLLDDAHRARRLGSAGERLWRVGRYVRLVARGDSTL